MALNASAYAQDPAAALFGRSPTEQALVGASATNPFAPGLLIREEQRTKALIQQYMEALAQTNESRERVAGQELQYGDMDSQRDFIEGSRDRISDFSSALDYALPNMQYERPMQESADMTRLAQGQADVFGTGAKGVADLAAGGQVLSQGTPTPWGNSQFDPQSLMTPDQLDTSDGGSASEGIWSVAMNPWNPTATYKGADALDVANDPTTQGKLQSGGFRALPPNVSGADPGQPSGEQLRALGMISSQASAAGMTTEKKMVGDLLVVNIVKANGKTVSTMTLDGAGQTIDEAQ